MHDLSPLVPVLYFVVYSFIFCVALNRDQQWRLGLMFPLLLSAGLSFKTMNNLGHIPGLAGLWGLGLLVHVAHTTSVLYLEAKIPIHNLDLPQCQHQYTLRETYKIWQDPQLLSHPGRTTSTSRSPSQKNLLAFYMGSCAKLVLYWFIHWHVVSRIFPGLFNPIYLEDFSPEKWTVLRRILYTSNASPISLREVALRLLFPIYWLWTSFAILSAANIMLSLFFVSLRFDTPEEWPAIFGSIFEAYSIRRFWSHYWHQIPLPSYQSHARNILAMLGIQAGSHVGRRAVPFLIFATSGLTHATVSFATGDKCGYQDDFWFFMANFVAAAAESSFRLRSKTTKSRKSSKPRRDVDISRRILGYVWVYCFLVWILPKWQYPKMFCAIRDYHANLAA